MRAACRRISSASSAVGSAGGGRLRAASFALTLRAAATPCSDGGGRFAIGLSISMVGRGATGGGVSVSKPPPLANRRATIVVDTAAASSLALRDYYETVHPGGAEPEL